MVTDVAGGVLEGAFTVLAPVKGYDRSSVSDRRSAWPNVADTK